MMLSTGLQLYQYKFVQCIAYNYNYYSEVYIVENGIAYTIINLYDDMMI